MLDAVRLALAFGPLAGYFLVLGAWRAGRRPRVVRGPLDFGLLAAGLGGLFAFGPIGAYLVRTVFPAESLWAWLAIAASWGLVALLWAPRTARRLVIYNVGARALGQALRDALRDLPGEFAATLRGFEDAAHGQGVVIHVAPGGRTATVEAYGDGADALATAVEPLLRARLREAEPSGRSPMAAAWFALAATTLIGPVLLPLLDRPQLRAAVRALLNRLHGG